MAVINAVTWNSEVDATHELTPDGRIRRIFLRRPIHRTREILWRAMVEKTHPLRKKLGLYRKAQVKKAGWS
jgi:hypothetical protein